MPVTKSRNGMHEMLSLDQTNTARFLFGEDEQPAPSPDRSNFLQMNTTDDKFPILVRREDYVGGSVSLSGRLLCKDSADRQTQLAASHAALSALDLSSPEGDSNGWGGAFSGGHRYTQSQQSNGMSNGQSQGQTNGSSTTSQSNGPESPASARQAHRHSLDMKFYSQEGSQDGASQNVSVASPPKSVLATPPKLQSSYSANDVPTMRSTTNGISSINSTPNSHAQQHLHNHNASLGRIPPNAMNNRLSREMTSTESATLREAQNGGYQSIQSALHASAPSFGPSMTQSLTQAPLSAPITSPTSQQAYPMPGYYNNNGYGVQMLTMGMSNMAMSPPPVGQQMYSPHNPYAYGMYQQAGPPAVRDSQARVIQQRRQNDGEGMF